MQSKRPAARVTQEEREKALADIGSVTAEQVRATIAQMLGSTKAILDIRKAR